MPVKDLRGTKSRLAPILDPGARAGLTLYMMGRVVRAIAEAGVEDVCVVSPDRIVLEEAKRRGATPLVQESRGLNPALEEGRRRALGSVPRALLDLPADLRSSMRVMFWRCRRRVRDLRRLYPRWDARSGTNALLIQPSTSCPSPSRQTASRHTLGLRACVAWTSGSARRPHLAFDLDGGRPDPPRRDRSSAPVRGIEVLGVEGFPEVRPGDDLNRMISDSVGGTCAQATCSS